MAVQRARAGRPRSNYYGFADEQLPATRDADIASAKVEHDFSRHVSVTDQVRYANYGRDAQITEAKIRRRVTARDAARRDRGHRNQITVDSTETFLQNQFDVTEPLRAPAASSHTLVAGLEAGARDVGSDAHRRSPACPTRACCARTSSRPFAGTPTITSSVKASAVSAGVYALDTVELRRASWT